MGFQEYAITMNVFSKRVDKVIEKEEQHIQRLQIDAISERKQSLVTDMVAKQEKVTELQQGKVIPLTCLFAVRLWHRNADQLAARCASLKNAFISMGGAVVHHATIPENARQLFFQTWPGWTFGTYRAFDRRRLLPCRHDSLVRHFHRPFGRRRSDLQRGKRQSCRNQNEARKHSSTRRTVRYDRRWQIGHCCGSIGTDWTSVWIQVDCRRRLVACSADPDSRLRADHRESERLFCFTEIASGARRCGFLLSAVPDGPIERGDEVKGAVGHDQPTPCDIGEATCVWFCSVKTG